MSWGGVVKLDADDEVDLLWIKISNDVAKSALGSSGCCVLTRQFEKVVIVKSDVPSGSVPESVDNSADS